MFKISRTQELLPNQRQGYIARFSPYIHSILGEKSGPFTIPKSGRAPEWSTDERMERIYQIKDQHLENRFNPLVHSTYGQKRFFVCCFTEKRRIKSHSNNRLQTRLVSVNPRMEKLQTERAKKDEEEVFRDRALGVKSIFHLFLYQEKTDEITH